MFLEILQAVTGIFVVVYDGQHALKFTLGRAQNVVGPGVHFKFPIVQRFRVVETKDTTIDLEPQIIQLRDDLVYEVGAKAVYQIVDLRKALIEIDNLVTGLKNRLVLTVQRVVRAQDRASVRDMARMIATVKEELRPVEEQWGVHFHEFGFSTFSPTPETLEITQLRKLAEEKLQLYQRFRYDLEMSDEAAVALISGAVIAVRGDGRTTPPPPPKERKEIPTVLPAEGDAAALADNQGVAPVDGQGGKEPSL
jgi:regulator of protease activity HflC (stomatin/prohibitin superfamily)